MAENRGKNTPCKNIAARKADRYEGMREKIKFASAISGISKAERAIFKSALAKVKLDENGEPDLTDKLSRDDVAALKVFLDSKWARINKLLPNLKAMEIEGGLDLRTLVRVVNLTGEDDESESEEG